MQVIKITEDYAVEQSTFAVDLAFTDEDEAAVTPDTVSWTLTDKQGNVINDHEDESETPGSSMTILLSGDDLAFQAGESGDSVWRILTIEATYTSDLGAGLPLKDSLKFPLRNLVAVA
jgi:hypothetical protein